MLLILMLSGGVAGSQGQVPNLSARDADLIKDLVVRGSKEESVARRIDAISEAFLGRRYRTRPLIGSPRVPEVLTLALEGFDCVTFVETVLALATIQTPEEFGRQLASIRYRGSQVDWNSRLHYATVWSSYQVARGVLTRPDLRSEITHRSKLLYRVKGLDPVKADYSYYPKRLFGQIAPSLQSGDIIFFVSGTNGLDTNHTGFVIRRHDQLLLRSASRSQRGVSDQPLGEYIRRNGLSGFFVNRAT